MLKAVYPFVNLCLRLCCARVSVLNRLSTVLVWCIDYCASARTSDVLVLVSTLLHILPLNERWRHH